jgi:hypothetical protein
LSIKAATFTVLLPFSLAGCITLSGTYKVTATKADGTAIPIDMMAQGSGIYTSKNAICAAYPGATVVITDAVTGQELKGESPRKCK